MSRRIKHWASGVAACLLGLLAPGIAAAQNIATDGSLGAKVALSASQSNNFNYAITANLGTQRGGNLFHSFSQFGLVKGETATFTGPATVTNVIGRVTGGSQSSIDGKIDASGMTGANLYLINPSGIVFGPNATVNVSGSFHASTADYLKMADGAKFQATNSGGSTLSAAAPAAFGFLNASPPAITINGSQLGVTAAGATLGMVGGPVTIGQDAASGAKATLTAPAGTIHLTSVASAGEVPVDPTNSAALTAPTLGTVSITGGAKLDVSDPTGLGSGGSVYIRAGTLMVSASEINADNYGSGTGGILALRGDSAVTLDTASAIHAVALASGRGADVSLSGGTVTLDNAMLRSGAQDVGAAGDLTVTAGDLGLHNGAGILSQTAGAGAGGSVTVAATKSLTLDGAASLGTTTASTGNAGNVTVSVSGPITVDASGAVDTSPLNGIGSKTGFAGNSGNVTITATGALSIIGPGSFTQFDTGIFSSTETGSPGNAGNVAATAAALSITNSGQLFSSTRGSGNSAAVSVTVQGAATIDGQSRGGASRSTIGSGAVGMAATGHSGNVSVVAATLDLANGGTIANGNAGFGHGGNVSIDVERQLTVEPSSVILAGTTTPAADSGNISITAGSIDLRGIIFAPSLASGNAGNISVKTGAFSMSQGAVIVTQANPGSTGNAGGVTISADTLSINNAGQIVAGTFGPGHAGDVSVNLTGALTLDAAMAPASVSTGISAVANTGSSGNAGNVTITAGSVSLANGGQISVTTQGGGNAGNVTISTGTLSIASNATIANGTFGAGNAGDVAIRVSGAMTLDGSAGISVPTATGIVADAELASAGTGGGASSTGILAGASSTSTGNGGNVSIAASSLTISGGGLILTGTNGPGNAGNVSADIAGALTITGTGQSGAGGQANNVIAGTSGNAGDITIRAGSLKMSNGGVISGQASTANGGDITISVRNLMLMRDSEITTQVDASIGNGGNIAINGGVVVLDPSRISAAALGSGRNGNVTINADAFIQSADSTVTATGIITFVNPPTSLGSALTVLPNELRSAADVSRSSCAARGPMLRSSLTESGRGGLSQDPDATMPGLYLAGRDVALGSAVAAGTPLAPLRSEEQTGLGLSLRCGR